MYSIGGLFLGRAICNSITRARGPELVDDRQRWSALFQTDQIKPFKHHLGGCAVVSHSLVASPCNKSRDKVYIGPGLMAIYWPLIDFNVGSVETQRETKWPETLERG